ncbi:HNH endonuclease [Brevibacillus sp. 179-C9.3 HS]|uniref:HNH endonuclease n=1 Tax=unclassified Brevibacillus TaxID=2684853 RepID=UPI0039A1320E
MAQFSSTLKNYFGAKDGAYSQVTNREATGDRSVTLDIHEKNIIYSVYPPDSFARRGGVISTANPLKEFFVHDLNNNSRRTQVTIVYPKKTGQELRLYFSKDSFEANTNDIWYIFTKEGENIPHIGAMDPEKWEQAMKGLDKTSLVYKSQQNIDDEDDVYQKEIGAAAVKLPTASNSLKYPRNPSVALKALEASNYLCEADPAHSTFISVTGKPYLECHHFIPISLQERYSAGLDVEENIVALCPNCHRFIHYGVGEAKLELLTKLWKAKKDGLASREINIRFEDLIGIYMA